MCWYITYRWLPLQHQDHRDVNTNSVPSYCTQQQSHWENKTYSVMSHSDNYRLGIITYDIWQTKIDDMKMRDDILIIRILIMLIIWSSVAVIFSILNKSYSLHLCWMCIWFRASARSWDVISSQSWNFRNSFPPWPVMNNRTWESASVNNLFERGVHGNWRPGLDN